MLLVFLLANNGQLLPCVEGMWMSELRPMRLKPETFADFKAFLQ